MKPGAASKYLRDVGIVVTRDGETDALPAIRNVWETVGTLDVRAAEPLLQRKSREEAHAAETDLSISGLKIRSSVIAIGAPLVILVLFLYLLVLISHVARVATSEDSQLFRTYPFLPTIKSKLALVLTFLSLVLLPSAAASYVTMSSGLGAGITRGTSMLESIVLIMLGISVFAYTLRLKRLAWSSGGGGRPAEADKGMHSADEEDEEAEGDEPS
ncbi:MAG: hypothetical protein ABSG65_00755 [Bryobacteraceae bacterium]